LFSLYEPVVVVASAIYLYNMMDNVQIPMSLIVLMYHCHKRSNLTNRIGTYSYRGHLKKEGLLFPIRRGLRLA
jgi:hypothetical protein